MSSGRWRYDLNIPKEELEIHVAIGSGRASSLITNPKTARVFTPIRASSSKWAASVCGILDLVIAVLIDSYAGL
jgi:hypothetical protein